MPTATDDFKKQYGTAKSRWAKSKLRLNSASMRLEQRLEAMYIEKLDGKVGERFYEQKSAEWPEDQKDTLR